MCFAKAGGMLERRMEFEYAGMHMRRCICGHADVDMEYADVPTKSSQVLVYGCCRRRRMRSGEISVTACIYYGAEEALYMQPEERGTTVPDIQEIQEYGHKVYTWTPGVKR